MQPPFQARTHALRMRPIHLMHRYLSLATEFLHAGSGDVNVRCSSRKQRRRIGARQLFLPLSDASVRRGTCNGECNLPRHTGTCGDVAQMQRRA